MAKSKKAIAEETNITRPKRILFINEKGGCGKTTLVDEMCFLCDMYKIPYSLHNLDPQGSILHEPVIRDNAVFDFIDTPGRLHEKAKEMMDEADLIVIPTQMTQNCMSTMTMMLEMTRSSRFKFKGNQALIVLNCWDGGIACEEFEGWIDKITNMPQYQIPTIHVSRSVNFANARMYNMGVTQYRYKSKSSREIEALFDKITDMMGVRDILEESKCDFEVKLAVSSIEEV